MAGLGKEALPDVSGDDEVHSEPTKVGDGAIAIEEAVRVSLDKAEERATSKMAPFQLEEVLQRARTKGPSLAPPPPPPPAPPAEADRVTVPGTVAGAESAPDSVVIAPATDDAAESPRDIGAIVSILLAAVFVVLTCAVLLSR